MEQQEQKQETHNYTKNHNHTKHNADTNVDTTERDERRAMEKEQAYFRKQIQGLLPLNLGALFMPPIWGPAHGIWITILFYPLWLFADNLFYAAFTEPTTLTVVCAVLVFIGSVVVTVLFAWVGQRYALRRALTMGKTKEEYQKKQRIWAICMALVAIIFIALATWYNLDVRPFVEFPEA